MASFDTLSMTGTELTAEQLEDVDGGFVWVVIGALALFDAGLWGYILSQ